MIFEGGLRKIFELGVFITSGVLLAGCATGILLPKVGNRSDQLTYIDRVASNGQEVILFYRVSIYAGSLRIGGREVESGVPKWSKLNLQTLELRSLVWRGVSTSTEFRLDIEDGQRPVLDSSYKEVPILVIPAENRIQNEKYVQDLAAAAQPYELSIHIQYTGEGPIHSYLILIDNRKREGGPPQYNDRIRPPMREYQAWWAIPARVALAPIAIGTDLLLSPVYLACLALGCKT